MCERCVRDSCESHKQSLAWCETLFWAGSPGAGEGLDGVRDSFGTLGPKTPNHVWHSSTALVGMLTALTLVPFQRGDEGKTAHALFDFEPIKRDSKLTLSQDLDRVSTPKRGSVVSNKLCETQTLPDQFPEKYLVLITQPLL